MDFNCIFEFENSKCDVKMQSFKGVICEKHLADIYGLEAIVYPKTEETTAYFIGPYLTPTYRTSFEPGTVILPDKEFFDRSFHTHHEQVAGLGESYQYQMNPYVKRFVNDMTRKVEAQPSKQREFRYCYEIMRHLSVSDPSGIENFDENLRKNQTHIQAKLLTLKQKIQNSNSYPLFSKITTVQDGIFKKRNDPSQMQSTSSEDAQGGGRRTDDSKYSAFHQFILSNLLHSQFRVSSTNEMYAVTLVPNVEFKEKHGLVALEKIMNNGFLVSLSHNLGSNHFYQLKVAGKPFPIKDAHRFQKRDMADALHMYNNLTGFFPA